MEPPPPDDIDVLLEDPERLVVWTQQPVPFGVDVDFPSEEEFAEVPELFGRMGYFIAEDLVRDKSDRFSHYEARNSYSVRHDWPEEYEYFVGTSGGFFWTGQDGRRYRADAIPYTGRDALSLTREELEAWKNDPRNQRVSWTENGVVYQYRPAERTVSWSAWNQSLGREVAYTMDYETGLVSWQFGPFTYQYDTETGLTSATFDPEFWADPADRENGRRPFYYNAATGGTTWEDGPLSYSYDPETNEISRTLTQPLPTDSSWFDDGVYDGGRRRMIKDGFALDLDTGVISTLISPGSPQVYSYPDSSLVLWDSGARWYDPDSGRTGRIWAGSRNIRYDANSDTVRWTYGPSGEEYERTGNGSIYLVRPDGERIEVDSETRMPIEANASNDPASNGEDAANPEQQEGNE